MCQINYTTESKKNKPLDQFELSKIELMLNECYSATQIAVALDRDASCIQKEIKKFSVVVKINKDCKVCNKYEKCRKTAICGEEILEGFCSRCKDCKIAVDICEEYEPIVKCYKLSGRKKVCNGCPNFKQCRKAKLVYIAKKAWKKHQENKINSIKKMKEIENNEYMDELSAKVKRGISPEVALKTTKNKTGKTISLPTLYLRIDRGLMKCKNIDLRNKLKRKPKKEIKKEIKHNTGKHRANGRSYGDLSKEEKENKLEGFAEMDTVEGIKGSKLLMTLINKKTSFLFGIPISNKKQENIIKELNKLEFKMEDKFKLIMGKIITDNGCEFLDYKRIEKSIKGDEKRISLYYADPYASYQKGQIENQHRLIRYFYPKGIDFEKYKDKDIIDKINRINNYPRKNLNWSTPYKEMEKIIGKEMLKKLGFYEITIDKLNMSKKKVA
ncbi:MAG: IS30 family transposase [Clostridia bacterium]|nr:IS30 family transposase [Clostridia bacterium]